MRRPEPLAAILAFVLGTTACAAPRQGGASSAPSVLPTASASASGPIDEDHKLAQEDLDRWAAAVAAAGGPPWFSVAVENRSGIIGDWETEEIGSNGKIAWYAGAVQAAPLLPATVPAPADVRWDDGVVRTMPLISARDALAAFVADGTGQCGGCSPLIVTGAMLSFADVTTSRGQAAVPVWEFALRGTAVRLTRVAVSPAATATVSPREGATGRQVESAKGTSNGRDLTVTFTGSPGPGSQPCGADYDAEAVESDLGVVVIIHEHRYVNPDPSATDYACTAVGAFRSVTVRLAEPLGDRAVLNLPTGVPVPVTLTS